MRTIAVVTTYPASAYELYARRMIHSWDRHWPREVELHVYYEGTCPDIVSDRIHYHDYNRGTEDLRTFKQQNADNAAAHGIRVVDGQRFYDYRLDAVRFAHKMFCIFDVNQRIDTDLLFWLDADTITERDIPLAFLSSLVPEGTYTCYLGRERYHSECGLVGYNRADRVNPIFMSNFRSLYLSGKLFKLSEWHDSFLYDVMRYAHEKNLGMTALNISGDGAGTMHPFVNSRLGYYMDHLKGPERKHAGASSDEDYLIDADDSAVTPLYNVAAEPEQDAPRWYRALIANTQRPRYAALLSTIYDRHPARIVEIGVADGERAEQMILTAALHRGASDIHYDGFALLEQGTDESRPTTPALTALQARLESTGAHIQLHAGNTGTTLRAAASAIGEVDLIVIDGARSLRAITSDWEIVRGLMGEQTVVIFDDYSLDAASELAGIGCQPLIAALDRDSYDVEVLGPLESCTKPWGTLEVGIVAVTRRSRARRAGSARY